MEGKDKPVEFPRVLQHIKVASSLCVDSLALYSSVLDLALSVV